MSDDLFKEWDNELKQYSDRSLRAESERELKATRQRCETLIRSMERAQRRLEPVLKPLRDRVLALKHNLNAQAIGALDGTLLTVRADVDALVADLEAAISEADQFVASMATPTSQEHTSKATLEPWLGQTDSAVCVSCPQSNSVATG